jgi:hypothetical protein
MLRVEAKRCVRLIPPAVFRLNPDGTVTATIPLVNCSNVDLNISLRIRHKQGWEFEIDAPQLNLGTGVGPVKITVTLRPPHGRSAADGDGISLEITCQGQTLHLSPHHVEFRAGPPAWMRPSVTLPAGALLVVGAAVLGVRRRKS